MSFLSELDSALETPSRRDTASRVHELVSQALHRLEPRAEIKHTDYFTHSFVPDLVMKWGPDDDRRERHVYLRFSVTRRAFAQDLEELAGDSPVFLGMTDSEGLRDVEWGSVNEPGSALNGTLVTQGAAIDGFDSALRQDARARRATGPIVRLGHGLVDESLAEDLAEGYVAAAQSTARVATGTPGARELVNSALDALRGVLLDEGQLDVAVAQFLGATGRLPQLVVRSDAVKRHAAARRARAGSVLAHLHVEDPDINVSLEAAICRLLGPPWLTSRQAGCGRRARPRSSHLRR